MKKINKKTIGIVSLGALAVIGGTFAYYTASNSLDNPLSTGDYNTVLVEKFTPTEDDMQPGAKWDKDAGAANTGDYPVLVRIKMDEKWQYKGEDTPYKTLTSLSDLFDNDIETPETINQQDVTYYLAQQDDDTDGYTPDEDGTVLHKNIVTKDADGTVLWVHNDADGYWYWNGVLEEEGSANSTTTNLLQGLVVTTNIDLGYYETKEYYAITDDGQPSTSDISLWDTVDLSGIKDEWPEADSTTGSDAGDGLIDIRDFLYSKGSFPVSDGFDLYRMSSSEIDSDRKGYADSNYTLTITAEFVQATVDAVKENWTEWSSVVDKLTNIKADDIDYVNN